mmetsp:Transcript_22831/g.58128  ORF Transcript_22831/g.58128 Transcript_22831/m.58128 type:complete len:227 (-) Transcript_22831:843-1523(-)
MSSVKDRRVDRKPCQWKSDSEKKALKKSRICARLSDSSMSMPKLLNARWRMRSTGHVARQMAAAMASASASFLGLRATALLVALSAGRDSWSMMASDTVGAAPSMRDIMNPVEGCTMPAVPPMPSTRCGCTGSTPPMGIRQYSSSSIFLTLMPMCLRRASSRSLSSLNPTAGRATSDVSSTKILVFEKGMAYRKVGSAWFSLLITGKGSVWSSLQSMNSMVSISKG